MENTLFTKLYSHKLSRQYLDLTAWTLESDGRNSVNSSVIFLAKSLLIYC